MNVFETAPIDASLALDAWTEFTVSSAPAPAGTAHVNYVLVHVQLGDGAGGFVGGAVFLDDASLQLIPEPATLGMVGVGLVGFVGFGIRRRGK